MMATQPSTTSLGTPLLGYATGLHIRGAGESDNEAYAQGLTLIVSNGSTLPNYCVLCGEDGTGNAIRLTLTWDSSFQMTRTSTLELRKQAILFAHLCKSHRRKWLFARRAGIVGCTLALMAMTAGLTLAVISESSDLPWYTPIGIDTTIAGFGLMILSLFIFTLGTRTLTCSRIAEGYLHLEGAGERFLTHLPASGTPSPKPLD